MITTDQWLRAQRATDAERERHIAEHHRRVQDGKVDELVLPSNVVDIRPFLEARRGLRLVKPTQSTDGAA